MVSEVRFVSLEVMNIYGIQKNSSVLQFLQFLFNFTLKDVISIHCVGKWLHQQSFYACKSWPDLQNAKHRWVCS